MVGGGSPRSPLTQIRCIWAVRGQNDGRGTCVTLGNNTPPPPQSSRKHDEVSISQENKADLQEAGFTFKCMMDARRSLRATLDSPFVGLVLL